MFTKNNNSLPDFFRKLSLILAGTILLVCIMVLIGWILGISVLKSFSAIGISMKVNTVLCFILAAASIIFLNGRAKYSSFFSKQRILSICSSLIIVISSISLFEHLFNFNIGIDELVFKDHSFIDASSPGRMPETTAICFILFGLAFRFDDRKISFYLFQFCSVIAGVIAFSSLLHYVIHSETLSGVKDFSGMSFQSSVCFILLMLATLYTRPERGIMKVVSRDTYSGKNFRIVFPISIMLLIIPATIEFYGVKHGLFGHNNAAAFLIFIQVLSASTILWSSEYILSKAESKLAQTEINLKSIFGNSHSGFILINSYFFIISFNSRAYDLIKMATGHSLKTGILLTKLLPPDKYMNLLAEVNKVLKGESVHFEVSYPNKEDGVIWLEIVGKPVKDNFGAVIDISLSINDITESKKIIHELLESEMKFKSVLQSAKDAIIMADNKGSIIFWNAISENMFGYTEKEIMGKSLTHIIPEHQKEEHLQTFRKHSSKRMTHSLNKQLEYNGLRKDGSEFPIELSISFWTGNKGKYYCAIIRDISRRKKAEEEKTIMNSQLRELSAHMQTAREQERTMIAREIHDELGGELACIKMDAEWLKKNVEKDAKVNDKITDILEQIDITINFVRKISSDIRPPLLDEMGLYTTIEWKCKDFSMRTAIKCIFQFVQEEPPIPPGFAIHIYRILQESLTNTFKYADASEIIINAKCENSNLVMTISDNGKGFDPEESKHIKSFGLIGMRERANAINGNIKILSEHGKGTTIELTIPLAETEQKDAPNPSENKVISDKQLVVNL